MGLFFVDVEAYGHTPRDGEMTEFGIVAYPSRKTFHGVLIEAKPDPMNPAVPDRENLGRRYDPLTVATACDAWLASFGRDRAVMVSDNPAYDAQFMFDFFWRYLNRNPFGHSARRISDFYAGLVGDWSNTQKWKRLRVTPHDHDPVHDSLGNVEAFDRLMKGER